MTLIKNKIIRNHGHRVNPENHGSDILKILKFGKF